jgi:hypothetical protein
LQVLFAPAVDTSAARRAAEAATADGLGLEVKQMAMETWLRQLGLAHVTPAFLALGFRSVEDLSDPTLVPDSVLLAAGLSRDQVEAHLEQFQAFAQPQCLFGGAVLLGPTVREKAEGVTIDVFFVCVFSPWGHFSGTPFSARGREHQPSLARRETGLHRAALARGPRRLRRQLGC